MKFSLMIKIRGAQVLDIPYYVMNFKKEFRENVMDYFTNEYLCGRTPNPCIACNRYLKWEALLQRSLSIGADYIATGHYARIEQLANGRYAIANSVTAAKDQTYALYNLTQETEKLTAAAQAVARKELDSAVFSGAKVREYESALQALQTMGDALTGSLQRQWQMEQQQREQILQLSHKLKTPLTIVEGNAELLAEDALTPEQREQVQAILGGVEQTRTYLGRIRAEVQTPLKYKTKKNDKTCRISAG